MKAIEGCSEFGKVGHRNASPYDQLYWVYHNINAVETQD